MFVVALLRTFGTEKIIGLGQYWINQDTWYGELAFVVADEYHRMGVCEMLYKYLKNIAIQNKLVGFTAEVLKNNLPMRKIFENHGFKVFDQSSDKKVFYKLKF